MRLDHLLSKEHWRLGFWSFVAGGSLGCPGSLFMAGCAVGVAQGWNIGYLALVVRLVVSTGSSFWGWVEESGVSGGWCLARCWVLKARAFFCSGFSVWALLAGVLLPCWGGGAGVCGVPPVF